MNSGKNAFPASIVETARKRSSLTSRSCSVLFIRSTRPFACGECRADDLDVELGQGAPELRHTAGPARRALVVHAEDAVLVAVEGHRLAVSPEIPAGRREVVECGLDLDEAQLHQAPGGVVDVNQQ